MSILTKYIPFHLILGLILGILFEYYTNLWILNHNKIILYNLIILALLLFTYRRKLLFQISCFFLYIFVGRQSLYLNDLRNSKDFYIKKVKPNSTIILEIKKTLKSNSNDLRFEANVNQVDKHRAVGKILLSITKDSMSRRLKVGNQILTTSKFTEIPKPKNPYSYNYRNYLYKKGIHTQMYLKNREYKTLNTNTFSIYSIAAYIRNSIQQKLKNEKITPETFAIINAMLLGDKKFISSEIRENYTEAGVIHILAISGLHIGVLSFILMFIFNFIEKYNYGNIIKAIIIILILWSFALISGLSASVVRAVTMFSFVILGNLIKRKIRIEFSLISSMLLILLFNPLFLFDVGFQMSYLAVFGIIWIRPLFLRLWNPKRKIVLFFWNVIIVSTSAQIAVLPLSLFYFHQLAGLFLLANIIIIPCISYIIGFGILIIISTLIDVEIPILYSFYNFVILLLNKWITFISNFDKFIYDNIYISFTEMLLYYLIIVLIYKFLSDLKAKRIILLLLGVTAIQSLYIYQKWEVNNRKELIVFNIHKHTIITKSIGTKLKLYSDTKTTSLIYKYKIKRKIKNIQKSTVPNLILFNKEILLIVDSIGTYNINKLKEPIVLLRKSPKINLDRLIKTIKPKQIIADASNYKTYTSKWEKTCIKYNIPFHSTYEKGYWKIYN